MKYLSFVLLFVTGLMLPMSGFAKADGEFEIILKNVDCAKRTGIMFTIRPEGASAGVESCQIHSGDKRSRFWASPNVRIFSEITTTVDQRGMQDGKCLSEMALKSDTKGELNIKCTNRERTMGDCKYGIGFGVAGHVAPQVYVTSPTAKTVTVVARRVGNTNQCALKIE